MSLRGYAFIPVLQSPSFGIYRSASRSVKASTICWMSRPQTELQRLREVARICFPKLTQAVYSLILGGFRYAIDDEDLYRAFRRFQLQPKLLVYRVQKRRARQVGLHAVGRDDC